MINFKVVKGRNYWGMSQDDLNTFGQIIWLLKHTSPPVGFNRKPLTIKQQKLIEDFYERINFPDNYAEKINHENGQ